MLPRYAEHVSFLGVLGQDRLKFLQIPTESILIPLIIFNEPTVALDSFYSFFCHVEPFRLTTFRLNEGIYFIDRKTLTLRATKSEPLLRGAGIVSLEVKNKGATYVRRKK